MKPSSAEGPQETSAAPLAATPAVARERWDRLKQVFEGALERDPASRIAYLEAACGEDRELREEAASLLVAHEQADSFFDEEPISATEPGSSAVSESDGVIAPGTRIGPYEIVGFLKAGGMGEVYRARDPRLGREVAVKLLRARVSATSERVRRFEQEARAASALNHPNILTVHDVGTHDSAQYIVTELIRGVTLRERLAQGPLPASELLSVAVQLAAGLAKAHEAGIVHRDLKPDNVMLTDDGLVKILDFGLATLRQADPVAPDAETRTRDGVVFGTIGYMSPEQARTGPMDSRSDQFLFGAVLYEMATGRKAFGRATPVDSLFAILHEQPEPAARLNPGLPEGLQAIMERCLAKDPSQRYGSTRELLDALQALQEATRLQPELAAARREQRRRHRRQLAAVSAAVLAMLAAAAVFVWRRPARPRDRSDWVQLTKLPDSVVQPALSPDGRMLAFLRGAARYQVPYGRAQVYVKALPDGEPVQLTHDTLPKMSPVFSPDGSKIAYTIVDKQFSWDTWVVPASGGEPQQMLKNASGLVWTAPGQVLFSEMRKAPHMGIVAAAESRAGARDVYLPPHDHGMAHRSYLSPDGKSVLLAEMDKDHLWEPCRLVAMDGKSAARPVGPPDGGCRFGAWSPDGKWMYLTSNAGGTNHIWRQRFPDGEPEQLTSGPTEEEGVAMAPDGRSFVTAVAVQNASVWLHDASGERPISVEGNTVDARFTPDGKRLCYKIVKQATSSPWDHDGMPGELRCADLASGRSEPLVPGFQALDYDISKGGQDVVLEVADRDRTSQLWLAAFDRRSAPRQVPNAKGRSPRFGPGGEIFFRRTEGTTGFVYQVNRDGTGLRKAIEQPIPMLGSVWPDGRWIIGWAPRPADESASWQAFSLDGAAPIWTGGFGLKWSPAGDILSLCCEPIASGGSYIVPLSPSEALALISEKRLRSERDIAVLPGARRVDALTVPGPSPDVYAFYRSTAQRNLFRIPVP